MAGFITVLRRRCDYSITASPERKILQVKLTFEKCLQRRVHVLFYFGSLHILLSVNRTLAFWVDFKYICVVQHSRSATMSKMGRPPALLPSWPSAWAILAHLHDFYTHIGKYAYVYADTHTLPPFLYTTGRHFPRLALPLHNKYRSFFQKETPVFFQAI